MICDTQHYRIRTRLLHNALCLFPLGLCPSSLVAIINHVLSPVIVAIYLRCIDELLRIFPCCGIIFSQSVVRVHEYEFWSVASRKCLLMPSFPCQSLVSHRQCRVRKMWLNDTLKENRAGDHFSLCKATDIFLFMNTHFPKYIKQFRVIFTIPVISKIPDADQALRGHLPA